MHEPVIESLEELLSDRRPRVGAETHLRQCVTCREELSRMIEQQKLLQTLKAPRDIEPNPAFYARVMNRIEAQARPSIWSLFSESPFAKRLAYGSLTFALLFGSFLMTEQSGGRILNVNAPESILADDDQFQTVSNNPERDREAILVTLASYQE